MEPIRLPDDQLKSLQEAIPFHRPHDDTPHDPVISPEPAIGTPPSDPGAAPADEFDAEPYRKKFRRKGGGDVVQGTAYGFDRDILADPNNGGGKIDGGVSPL